MVKIKIPATSANLGAGFDTLGIAVSMYNEVEMDYFDELKIVSADDNDVPKDEENLIYQTAKYLFNKQGKNIKGLYIKQKDCIPMARGLGSSSACIVAGLFGANVLMGEPYTKDELINFSAILEGHPDNSTPAILGGIVTAILEDEKVYYIKHDIDEKFEFVAIIPDFELKTKKARSVIPQTISHKDAVYNISRSAIMAMSIAEGKTDNLRVACGDKLHQPYRLGLIEHAQYVFEEAYNNGACGVYLSGAGSTIMAIVSKENCDFYDKMQYSLNKIGVTSWKIEKLKPDNNGVMVQTL